MHSSWIIENFFHFTAIAVSERSRMNFLWRLVTLGLPLNYGKMGRWELWESNREIEKDHTRLEFRFWKSGIVE